MADKRQGDSLPSERLDTKDAFWLSDLYPDARALFSHERPNLSEIKDHCIVVLDANVLLFPFEMQSTSIDEIEKVYTTLSKKKRLVVPGQSAREFYKHRSNKIAAIADAIDGAIARSKRDIFDSSIPLLETDEDYENAKKLAGEVASKGKEIVKHLSSVNERLKDRVGGDRVSTLYRKLLGDCVCEIGLTDEQRNAMVNEVTRRARLEIAPGYKDHGKEDGGLGDYLIWRTILQEAGKRMMHCIFVTEEKKADWWIRRKGAFQPRPELLDEFRQATGGRSIHLVPLSALLSTFKANEEVVQQVQELEALQRRKLELSRNARRDRSDDLSSNARKRIAYLQKQMSSLKNDLEIIQSQLTTVENKIRNGEGNYSELLDLHSRLNAQSRFTSNQLREKEADLRNFRQYSNMPANQYDLNDQFNPEPFSGNPDDN